jgi:hypothetical protein
VTLDEKITDAQAKYHSLLTGTLARVFVDQNGERIEYNAANAPRLAAYIADLTRQKSGGSSAPMGVFF